MEDIYHYLWFFTTKTDKELELFKSIYNHFLEQTDDINALLALIFNASEIKEITNDWILTDNGLITISRNGPIITAKNGFTVTVTENYFKWTENDNTWELNRKSLRQSKITTKNNWTNESKESIAVSMFGSFVFDSFIHNDKYIFNVSKELLDTDSFDVLCIDDWSYRIVKHGYTDIYPLLIGNV